MSQNNSIPNTNGKPSYPPALDNNKQIRQATFIVGCLVAQDVILYDPDEAMATERFEAAVRIIAACLRVTAIAPGDGGFDLPFEW